MSKSKGMQLGAVLGAMLFMMATIAVPVAIADTGTPSSTQSTCTTCGAQTANCGSVNLTVTKLDGSESRYPTNFTQSGAIVREDLATVMINYSSKIASIIIPVQNGTGFITAEINLRNEKVISIVDPSYWDCVYGCMPDWLKGVCTVSCMNCATQLSIPWCLACGACGCGVGWCAGYCVPDAFKPILCPAAWLACIAGNGAACCVDSGCNA